MCVSFVMIPRNIVEQIVHEMAIKTYRNVYPDWPARHINAFPKSTVSLIVSKEDELVVEDKVWGYPVPWTKNPLVNTRIESALEKDLWRESLLKRRCIIPTFGFFEPHQSEKTISEKTGKQIKQQYIFEKPDKSPLFIAGIYKDDYFSMVTTEANKIMAPIHSRMPLLLNSNDLELWTSLEFQKLTDRAEFEITATKV